MSLGTGGTPIALGTGDWMIMFPLKVNASSVDFREVIGHCSTVTGNIITGPLHGEAFG